MVATYFHPVLIPYIGIFVFLLAVVTAVTLACEVPS